MNGTMNVERVTSNCSDDEGDSEFGFFAALLDSVVDELAAQQGGLTHVSLDDVKCRFTQALREAHESRNLE